MSAKGLITEREWSTVRWFAYAGAALTVTAGVGAYGMGWIAKADHEAQTAFLPLKSRVVAARPSDGIDMRQTGSIDLSHGGH